MLNRLALLSVMAGVVLVATLISRSAAVDKTTSKPVAPGSQVVEQSPSNSARQVPPPVAKAPFTAPEAKAHQEAWAKHLGTKVEATNSIGMTMVLIPPGEFQMGTDTSKAEMESIRRIWFYPNTNDAELNRELRNERPLHRVVITKPFLMGSKEVTIGQFKKFTATSGYVTEPEKAESMEKKPKITYLNHDFGVADDFPVILITWNDAAAYCKWLSDVERATYRLPTEAEWEYACRSGTTTLYSFDDGMNQLEQYAWYSKNSEGKLRPAGKKLPNAFGLYDMHGSLWEYCQDFYVANWYEQPSPDDPNGPSSGLPRVVRGGGLGSHAVHCRSAYRSGIGTPSYTSQQGFRCVRVW